MIKRLLKCSRARSLFHDLYDDAQQHRIEVKFSVVLKEAELKVTEETVLRCIEQSTAEERMVAFPSWQNHQFDCNIQQIKRTEFEVLYYGLFFSDCIQIFRIESSEINENSRGGKIYYSDFQHKGNAGEGQFHINPNTLPIHLKEYLYRSITYEELYQLLASPC